MAPATTADRVGPNCSFCGHAVDHPYPCPAEITVWATPAEQGRSRRATTTIPCLCARQLIHPPKGTT